MYLIVSYFPTDVAHIGTATPDPTVEVLISDQHLYPQSDDVQEGELRALERFASSFKTRRIKLGFTQTNVGKL